MESKRELMRIRTLATRAYWRGNWRRGPIDDFPVPDVPALQIWGILTITAVN